MDTQVDTNHDEQYLLEQIAVEMTGMGHNQLAGIVKDGLRIGEKHRIESFTGPASWRLCEIEDNQEAVFTVQGIIRNQDLPPIVEKPRRTPPFRYRFIKQTVELTGLDSPTFTQALQALQIVHSHFDRLFREGVLEPLAIDSVAGLETITLSNRYLTPRSEAGGMEATPYWRGVDPNGVLATMEQGSGMVSYIHTEDNKVKYYTSHRDRDGCRRYAPCEPQIFRVGDIVQAQMTFVAVPAVNEKRKLLCILRSLALITKRTRKVNHDIARMTLVSIKRRSGYGDEEQREKKRERMVIDEE